MESRVQEYFESAAHQTNEMVESRPLSFAAIAFGMGVAVGIAAVAVFSAPKPESSLMAAERYAANYAKQLMDRLSAMAPSSWKS